MSVTRVSRVREGSRFERMYEGDEFYLSEKCMKIIYPISFERGIKRDQDLRGCTKVMDSI